MEVQEFRAAGTQLGKHDLSTCVQMDGWGHTRSRRVMKDRFSLRARALRSLFSHLAACYTFDTRHYSNIHTIALLALLTNQTDLHIGYLILRISRRLRCRVTPLSPPWSPTNSRSWSNLSLQLVALVKCAPSWSLQMLKHPYDKFGIRSLIHTRSSI